MAQLKQEIDDTIRAGYKLVYIDETVFTRNTVNKSEWSAKKSNAHVDQNLLNEKPKALLMGISAEEGVEQWRVFAKSVDTKKFLIYLDMVRDANPNKKVALFMDNLNVHRTKAAKMKMEELGIKPIYNIYYQCELNPIESCFSKIKTRFKALRAAKLSRGIKPNLHTLISQSIKVLEKQYIQNCIGYARKQFYL